MAQYLIQLKAGVWKARVPTYRDQEGKQHYKTKTIHGSKREAQVVLAQLKAKHQLATHDLAGEETTVEALLRRWLDAKRDAWSPKTVRETQAFVDRRIVPQLGDRRIGKLGVREVEEWYASLLKAGRADGKGGLAPASVRRIHVVLHSAFAQALRWDLLGRNVFDRVRAPSVPAPEHVMPPIGDVARVVDRLLQRDPFFGTLLRLAVITGARRGELCALRWKDLDLVRMSLTIAGSISDGPQGLVVKRPKTNRSRTVPLDPGTVEALKGLRDRCGVPKSDAFVFSQAIHGMTPMHPSSVTHRWIREATAAGLKGVRLHDLRHLMVTTLLDAGVPVALVSQRAGHSSKTVTLNTYAHAVQDSERAAADVIAGQMRTLTGQPVSLTG